MMESRQRPVLYFPWKSDGVRQWGEVFINASARKKKIQAGPGPERGAEGRRIQRAHLLPRVILPLGVLVLLVLAGLWLNRPQDREATASSQLVFVPARVTAVLEDDAQPDWDSSEGRRVGTQELEIRLLSGAHKGEILPLTNYLSVLYNVDVGVGDRIIVRLITQEDGSYYASLFNYDRGLVLGGALLVFCAVLVLLGGRKGVRALLGLVFTLLCLWLLLIPGLIRGLPALPLTIGVVAVTAAASLVLLDGFSRKCLCAVLGCVGGVTVAGLFAALVGWITPLNGFHMSEAENLMLYGSEQGLHISGLLVCGVLVAALGAVMDVAMSIASALWELRQQNPALKAPALFRSGMNIGRDAMGTMANTLILAFAGSSFNLLILIQVYDIPFLQLANTDFLCIEILQSVAGSLGILLTVPLVAAISAWLMARPDRVHHKIQKSETKD